MTKEVKSKRQIYVAILGLGILIIRNQGEETKSLATCFATADLIHNIPPNTLSDDFEEMDFYFLNIEVPSYVRECERLKIPTNAHLLSLAEELRQIVPEGLKSKLEGL